MNVEKRRYRIKGFRDDTVKIRVLLEPADLVTPKEPKPDFKDMMNNPMGIAQKMMSQQMAKVINDSFSVSREEYLEKKYLVGEFVTVTLQRE